MKAWLRLRAAALAFRPDVIYERFSLFLFAGLWLHRTTRLPLLLEVNAPLCEERAKNDGLKLHRLGGWRRRCCGTGVDQVLPVTGVLAGMVESYGVPRSRITVIPNGINPERFAAVPDSGAAKAALGLPPRLVLGFTGFVRGWNAVHRLIDFAALHQDKLDLHILVVGDGPARESLENHARDKGVADRLTISGVVERDDVARYVAAFDIAVLPGVTHYASPLKLFEYLQLGRAIVAPDSENIREILADGKKRPVVRSRARRRHGRGAADPLRRRGAQGMAGRGGASHHRGKVAHLGPQCRTGGGDRRKSHRRQEARRPAATGPARG